MNLKTDRPSIRLYRRYHVNVILLTEQRTNNKIEPFTMRNNAQQTKHHFPLDPLPVELETLLSKFFSSTFFEPLKKFFQYENTETKKLFISCWMRYEIRSDNNRFCFKIRWPTVQTSELQMKIPLEFANNFNVKCTILFRL